MRRAMARPLPDDRYLFDLTPLEIAKCIAGCLIGVVAVWGVAFAVSVL